MEFILDNKEWLFSGIGVLLLSFVMTKLFRKESALKMEQSSGDNSTNLQANRDIKVENINISNTSKNSNEPEIQAPKTYKADVDRQHVEVTVKEGGYVDIPWNSKDYRISIKNIVNEEFRSGYQAKLEDGVEIYVKAGGGLVYGGKYAKNCGTNQWKVPVKDESDEEPFSIYSHFVFEKRLSFFRCFVTHINPHSRDVTISVFIARVK